VTSLEECLDDRDSITLVSSTLRIRLRSEMLTRLHDGGLPAPCDALESGAVHQRSV
jgi:hypothetical protein